MSLIASGIRKSQDVPTLSPSQLQAQTPSIDTPPASALSPARHILPPGEHTFPFSFLVHESWPAVISSRPIHIQYHVQATLQVQSLLSFMAHSHHVSKPVQLLQQEEAVLAHLSDQLFGISLPTPSSPSSSTSGSSTPSNNTVVSSAPLHLISNSRVEPRTEDLGAGTQSESSSSTSSSQEASLSTASLPSQSSSLTLSPPPRLSSYISFPCKLLPQSATIPLSVNLALKGNATTVTKITLEMHEGIYALLGDSHADEASSQRVLLDERLVTRQNCPIQDWPSSTYEEPVHIPKRLLFKVPKLACSPANPPNREKTFVSSVDGFRLEKGFCHASGIYSSSRVEVTHTVRVLIHIQGLSNDIHSKIETDVAEAETEVWIVDTHETRDNDHTLPSYFRSFSTALVDGDRLAELDRQVVEALLDDHPPSPSAPSSSNMSTLPPRYEESIRFSSSPSSSVYDLTVSSSSSPFISPYSSRRSSRTFFGSNRHSVASLDFERLAQQASFTHSSPTVCAT
ncbi:hypothetical protein BGW38_008073 [Lunasporangiospora selenospora]|uniref:Uncharacterized protein n=1 Tax=Lunasporangiospora selenospora TaxID=979761 RepID=A0A9P6FLM7_9FUNG|nr:hypothetical protein BGW38_008073 [Lunasporangiospora selenospora]